MKRLSLKMVLLGIVVSALCSVEAGAAEKTSVQYRLTKAKTMHLDDEKTAKSYVQTFKKLGCESKLGSHAGHFDLTYKCPKWRKAEFDGHDAAHKWQKWLKSLGFETKHAH
jgi:hypothetical protein